MLRPLTDDHTTRSPTTDTNKHTQQSSVICATMRGRAGADRWGCPGLAFPRFRSCPQVPPFRWNRWGPSDPGDPPVPTPPCQRSDLLPLFPPQQPRSMHTWCQQDCTPHPKQASANLHRPSALARPRLPLDPRFRPLHAAPAFPGIRSFPSGQQAPWGPWGPEDPAGRAGRALR
eukprot:2320129-Rhodomonas_salina.3